MHPNSPFGKYIAHLPQRNRWAIADIHGCVETFEALLRKIDFRKDDQLFLLGDYINKGPDPVGVLDQIIWMQNQEFDIHPIRGNHEQIFMDYYAEKLQAGDTYILRQKVLSPALIGEDDLPIPRYLSFMQALPFFCESMDFFTVHANFNFSAARPLAETDSMLYSVNYEVDRFWLNGKRILHGHLPYELDDIQLEIAEKRPIINLDNGCVLKLQPEKFREGTGQLVALNLNSFELVVQPNIDQPIAQTSSPATTKM